MRCHSLKNESKKAICLNVFETKEVGSVSDLTLTLFSALEKGDGSGECLENTG